jgi:hypothetical protein
VIWGSRDVLDGRSLDKQAVKRQTSERTKIHFSIAIWSVANVRMHTSGPHISLNSSPPSYSASSSSRLPPLALVSPQEGSWKSCWVHPANMVVTFDLFYHYPGSVNPSIKSGLQVLTGCSNAGYFNQRYSGNSENEMFVIIYYIRTMGVQIIRRHLVGQWRSWWQPMLYSRLVIKDDVLRIHSSSHR